MKKILLLLLFITSSLCAQIPIGQPADLSACDNGNDGVETFDLTTLESEILNGLNPSEYSVSFFSTFSGAFEGLEGIELPTIYTNTTSPEMIYVRVEETNDPTNFEITTFELLVNVLPVFNIEDVAICEGQVMFLDSGLNEVTYQFQWFFGTSIIAGETANSLAVSTAGDYKLLVTDVTTGCTFEDSSVVTVNPSAVATLSGDNTINAGEIASVYILGTPDATILYSLNNGGVINSQQVTLDASGNLSFLIPNITTFATVCLIEATANPPFCTTALTNCLTIVANSTDIITIPDANFKAKLLQASTENNIAKDASGNAIVIDINSNGEIEESETLLPYALNVANSEITDLTGIEFFTNLEALNCEFNPLTSLNTSGLVNLVNLSAFNCSISNVNLSSSSNLKIVSLSVNELTSLDISNLVDLEIVSFADNQIDTIDLTGLTNLKNFYCEGNNLSSLDFTSFPFMEIIQCSDNQLIDLNVSGLVNLEVLVCRNNELTTLDLSGLNSLTYLRCNHNEIGNLNLTGATSIIEIDASENNLLSLDLTELQNLTKLSVPGNNLSVITGLPLCTNLTMLHCSSNQLTTLDVSTLVNLTYLNCAENLLQTLEVANFSNLLQLECSYNELQSLTLGNLPVLKALSCHGNQLSSIDANNYQTLEELSIGNNPLNTIDVSSLNNLTFLSCVNNQLTNLDTSNLTTLKYLSCSGNQLTSLNLDDFTVLETLHCHTNQLTTLNLNDSKFLNFVDCQSNQLTSLFLKNGKFESLYLQDNPLSYICADEMQVPFIQQQLTQLGLTATALNSYCSFTPGSEFNSITGKLGIDANNNGCDENDYITSLVKIKINNGLEEEYAFTNSTAHYTFYTQEGNFTITPELENPSYFTVAPVTTTVNFPEVDNSVSTNNFCITPNGVHPDVEIVIAPILPARPGFDAVYKIVYKNKGNQVLSGDISFEFNDDVLDLISSVPLQDNTVSGFLGYAYANLMPFENREILITFNVNGPMETPAVNIDDVLNFTASVVVPSDENPTDNTFAFSQVVVGSYDPNDKQCIEGDVLAPDEIGEFLHYLIRFENTGTAPAENIVVKDIIDTTMFEVSSLRIMNSSHPVEAKVTGNVAEFIFKNINLETNGHGNILLKVKTNAALSTGAVVKNKADIFFDYNFPIYTNEASTLFQDLGIEEYNIDASISIYPNPTKGVVNIKADSEIKSIRIYDVQGRLLMTRLSNQATENIDFTNYSTGVYYLNITTDKGNKTEKMIKQ